MAQRERLLAALRRDVPDCVPVTWELADRLKERQRAAFNASAADVMVYDISRCWRHDGMPVARMR